MRSPSSPGSAGFSGGGYCRRAPRRLAAASVLVFIYSAAFESFINPLLYFMMTYSIKDLSEEIKWCGLKFEARELVLRDITFSLCLLWEQFVILLSYGLISPLVAFAQAVNICSHAYLLRCSINRYWNLQFQDKNDLLLIKRNKLHIEKICGNSVSNFHVILWPGVFVISSAIGLFLLDMAFDNEDDSDDTGSGTYSLSYILMCVCFITAPVAFYLFYSRYYATLKETASTNGKKIKFRNQTPSERSEGHEDNLWTRLIPDEKTINESREIDIDEIHNENRDKGAKVGIRFDNSFVGRNTVYI